MNCRICSNGTNNKIYKVREMMLGLRDIFTYFQCSNCGCLQIANSPEDISKYYPSNYYSFSRAKKKSQMFGIKKIVKRIVNNYSVFDSGIIGNLIYMAFPEPSMRCLSAIPIRKNMRILEIGSGDGSFLLNLAEIGFTKLTGIDPFIKKDISYNKKVNIFKQTLGDVSGKWDIILFHHSFEHCEDPKAILMDVSKLLDHQGICIIRVPTVSSFAWEHYRTNWIQIDAPRHFFIPSIQSMGLLARKTDLRISHIEYDSNKFQFWGSEQYRNDIPLYSQRSYLTNPRKSMFTYKDIWSFKKRAKQLNAKRQGDQVALTLKKNHNGQEIRY